MNENLGAAPGSELELWAGVECTIVRIEDNFRNQLAETGHLARRDDIDRIAELGVRAVRYPLLWEMIAPESPDKFDFGWTDERLEMLRQRGIRIVGGLLHHGSGPGYTSLVDPDFAAKFGDFAQRVAERYSWVDMWTPVNEPLTTARFSCLYGHWYPHRRNMHSFLVALVNQGKATLAAMRAIRSVNPGALLLQTEDLGKTFSTVPLRYQATYENQRRWLSLDLLAGRVDGGHRWHRIFREHGIPLRDLEAFEGGEARPDLVGINHYLTSERFLDHRLDLYPGEAADGNGRDAYVDAEAVRIERLHGKTGISLRLREAWQRYRIPLVVSEVHHGCTRDEQLRWLVEVWNSARELRREGVDVRAVTPWSLFGNVDWRSLITRREGIYDVGAFDVRGEAPRPTIIAKTAAKLARAEDPDHPVLDVPGWWRRPMRLYPWHGNCREFGAGEGRKLLIAGATGTLGQAFARICEHRGLSFCITGRAELDLADPAAIAAALARYRPWAVINAAGYVRVADAEHERDACIAANATGAESLAAACAAGGIPLVTFSSDLVFDGSKGGAYREDDPTCPTCVYGTSKAMAEERVLAAADQSLIIRTSAFFGPWDRYNFAWSTLDSLSRGEAIRASRDTIVSPTYVPDLCHAALDLLIDGEKGIWHLANDGAVSWHEFARRLAEGAGYDSSLVLPVRGAAGDTTLGSSRGLPMRPLDQAIDAFLREIGQHADALAAQQVAAE